MPKGTCCSLAWTCTWNPRRDGENCWPVLRGAWEARFSPGRNKPPTPPEKDDNNRPLTDAKPLYCYRCNGQRHRSDNCPTRKCYVCGRHDHEARNCKSGVPKSRGQNKNSTPVLRNQVNAGCLVRSSPPQATAEDLQSCIEGDHLFLTCGKKISLLSTACVQPFFRSEGQDASYQR